MLYLRNACHHPLLSLVGIAIYAYFYSWMQSHSQPSFMFSLHVYDFNIFTYQLLEQDRNRLSKPQ